VASGKKTAPDLLAMLSTKAVFTEEQKAAILCLKPKAAEPPPAEASTAAWVEDMNTAEAQGAAQ